MSNYFYDQDTDTLYVSQGDGFGGLALLFVLSTPFFIIAVWLRQYALFAREHTLLFWTIFLGISAVLGVVLYRKRQIKKKALGIISVIVSLLPIALAQAFYAIPYILTHDGYLSTTFEWLIVTFFTVGISFFTIQISLLFKDGVTHFTISMVYFIISLIVIL